MLLPVRRRYPTTDHTHTTNTNTTMTAPVYFTAFRTDLEPEDLDILTQSVGYAVFNGDSLQREDDHERFPDDRAAAWQFIVDLEAGHPSAIVAARELLAAAEAQAQEDDRRTALLTALPGLIIEDYQGGWLVAPWADPARVVRVKPGRIDDFVRMAQATRSWDHVERYGRWDPVPGNVHPGFCQRYSRR